MKNPWLEITKDNKVLSCDNDKILKLHNEIKVTDYPEPFIGNPESEIYFLSANPGRNDYELQENLLTDYDTFSRIILENLEHKSNRKYPFYYLNPQMKNLGGYDYWIKCIKPILNQGIKAEILAKNFFSVELIGYHSKGFPRKLFYGKNRLPSIDYSKFLVKKAMEEGKFILLARSVRNWFNLIPELRNYNNCFFIANNREMVISETTLSPNVWSKLLETFKKKIMPNYAVIKLSGIDILVEDTFENIEEIRAYIGDNKEMRDVVKLIDITKPITYGNFIIFNDQYFSWLHLKKKLEKGEVSQKEFDIEFNQILHQGKIDIKNFQDYDE